MLKKISKSNNIVTEIKKQIMEKKRTDNQYTASICPGKSVNARSSSLMFNRIWIKN